MKTISIILIIGILFLFSPVSAETDPAPEAKLKKGDVEKFITTWPKLEKEMEQFGLKMDAKEGNVTVPEAYMAGQEYLSILKKYGWEEDFFQRFTVILQGYAALMYKSSRKDADSQISKSIREIESNPDLSEEMKKQLLEQLASVRGMMDQQGGLIQKTVHPADLALVKANLNRLKEVLEKEKKQSGKK